MTNEQMQILSQLKDWQSWRPIYENGLHNSETVASKEYYKDMVEHCDKRIAELEERLQQLKSA
ncbi:hypothetical protein D3C81_1683330 [compost metagenome]